MTGDRYGGIDLSLEGILEDKAIVEDGPVGTYKLI